MGKNENHFDISELDAKRLAVKNAAIDEALDLRNCDDLTADDFDNINTKAVRILQYAMLNIMKECKYTGSESIIQESASGNLTCRYSFVSLMEAACEDLDKDLACLTQLKRRKQHGNYSLS
ncbi:hypothetical protein [Halarcobacter anaerophilus]|uniref:Uncharacterized protein n=1 Tax=Halarcobacter anaerophilus TaxID=877500 RepID=A0A4Q0Y299_9BACT|nr:hypothetical protein [Halarcobacter anaerophilus]QDF28950.1 hypothetical protein AANAER_1470 [Halarcobacter anaerophilus]RXJ63585.1 hypothetical protein CRV06_05175 [Halarcobacter anaerophilus]